MVHFLFGKPGTGKTFRVTQAIRDTLTEDRGSVYLIVPEQAVYSAERGLLPALPPESQRRLSIVSFSRLADMVADVCGGRTFGSLTRASSALLMWRNLRELSGLLETFHIANGEDTSLCCLMLNMTAELSCNAIDSHKLESAAACLPFDSPLRAKLRDIALVAAAYDGLVRDLCGSNPADRLLRTARQVSNRPFFDGATVFIDSFTSFTVQEYALLRPLISQARDVTVTLTCSGRNEHGTGFDSIRDTVLRLTRLCEDEGIAWDDTVLEGNRRTTSPELMTLEAGMWNFGYGGEDTPLPGVEDRGSVRLVSVPNLYEEARAAALHIGELYNMGIPYGQIAIVVRNTDDWRGVLDAALETAHIPFFLSERTGLADKPATRLLLCALRCIQRGYQTQDVISLCKTGLCGLSLADLDAFSDYVETWRIRGRRMTEGPWSMNPDGYCAKLSRRGSSVLEAANRARETIIPPLLDLETGLSLASSPAEQCRALYEYMCTLSVREQLSEKAETYLKLGLVREAGEAVRLWSFLTSTLADISTLMPEEDGPLSVDELWAALSLVFDETDIGAVPARHDCVTVGSADTVRLENIRALLVLGLCEGEFPRSVGDSGLLTQQEKETLAAMGIEFASRADRLASEELLYIYRAVTTPSEQLLLFTHTSTPDGTARNPSIAYNRVRLLLPYLEPIHFTERLLETEAGEVYRPPLHDFLPPLRARAMLGDTIWLSQSKLQLYAHCPYSYYGTHILKLREKTEARLDTDNAGVFLHHVLEVYLRAALDGTHHIRHLSDSEVEETADGIMASYIHSLCGDVQGDGRILHLFSRLRTVALVLLRSIQAELEQGLFTTAGLEWDTHGKQPGDPQPMVIPLELLPTAESTSAAAMLSDPLHDTSYGPLPLSHGHVSVGHASLMPDSPLPLAGQSKQTMHICMGGIVDRVDVYRAGQVVYVRVIDYKSSKHTFSERSVTQDMNIQLLLYLFTLCAPRNRSLFTDENGILPDAVLPAEALYLSPVESPDDGSVSVCRSGLILNDEQVLHAASPDLSLDFLPGLRRKAATGELYGQGLCDPAHMQQLEQTVSTLIRQVTASMYEGKADRTPGRDACRYCAMKPSCPVAEAE